MYLVNYIVCIITLIIIDAPYLYLNSDLYVQKTKAISNDKYTNRYYSALIVYIALALGIIVLAVPQVRKDNWNVMIRDSIFYGGIFGITAYATFDFTMHFMFNEWDLMVSVMDTLWGGLLCSLATLFISWISIM